MKNHKKFPNIDKYLKWIMIMKMRIKEQTLTDNN